MFFKIGALKSFPNFTGKHLCWSLFLIKLGGLSCNPRNVLNISLNSVSSSSMATKFLAEKNMSSIVPHFLSSLPLIFSFLSFSVVNLKVFPFSVSVLVPLMGMSSLLVSVSPAATFLPFVSGKLACRQLPIDASSADSLSIIDLHLGSLDSFSA